MCKIKEWYSNLFEPLEDIEEKGNISYQTASCWHSTSFLALVNIYMQRHIKSYGLWPFLAYTFQSNSLRNKTLKNSIKVAANLSNRLDEEVVYVVINISPTEALRLVPSDIQAL